MGKGLESPYLEALELVNVSEVARETGRALQTLQAYKYGRRRVTAEAAKELVAYLQARADTLTAAAEELAAALDQEEADG